MIVSASFSENRAEKEAKINKKDIEKENFVNKDMSEGDPFITKVPKLEDMLEGPVLDKGDPSLGTNKAEVVIVEFADYECESCRSHKEDLNKLRKQYPDKVRLIWKDYPISDPESPSFRAAEAARCAGLQNKFWDYNDRLYKKNGNELDRDLFLQIAKKLEMDKRSFENCLDNGKMEELILDNIKEANALGITGIPFTYINDQEVMGKISYEELERMVEIEMKE